MRARTEWKFSKEALKITKNIYFEFINHTEEPYCVFLYGGSKTIIYELMYQLVKNNIALPMHIFISENIPPYDNIIGVEKANYREEYSIFIEAQKKQRAKALDVNISVFYEKGNNIGDLKWRQYTNKKYTEYEFRKDEGTLHIQKEEMEAVISVIINRDLVNGHIQQSLKVII